MPLSAIAINCSLKRSGGKDSSTDQMIGLLVAELKKRGVAFAETIRIADHDVKPGVSSDEGEGDAWPDIRRRILEADILIFGTPVWLGQMSSVAKRVIERMDAFLGETDERGRMPSYGKVAIVAIVGNEDGAHGISAHLYQGLNDTGWTIPAAAVCYWVGEAMGKTDFKDLREIPEKVRSTAATVASNAAHLAALLEDRPYPGVEG
jgi:multimeric flavodoxin WrbA